MEIGIAMSALKEGIMVMLLVSGIIVVPTFVVGLTISIFQATTQIQEQSLTFVPKLLITFGIMILLGPYMVTQLSNHFIAMLNLISKF